MRPINSICITREQQILNPHGIVLSANIKEVFSALGLYLTFNIASKSDQQLHLSPSPTRLLPVLVRVCQWQW